MGNVAGAQDFAFQQLFPFKSFSFINLYSFFNDRGLKFGYFIISDMLIYFDAEKQRKMTIEYLEILR